MLNPISNMLVPNFERLSQTFLNPFIKLLIEYARSDYPRD